MGRRRILRSEIDRLSATGRLDEAASKVLLCRVYEMPDGKVLLVYGDSTAFLDDSYAELVEWVANNAHRSGRVTDILPQGARFAETVPELIAALPREPGGQRYAPSRFYKELLELGRRASIAVFIGGTLH